MDGRNAGPFHGDIFCLQKKNIYHLFGSIEICVKKMVRKKRNLPHQVWFLRPAFWTCGTETSGKDRNNLEISILSPAHPNVTAPVKIHYPKRWKIIKQIF